MPQVVLPNGKLLSDNGNNAANSSVSPEGGGAGSKMDYVSDAKLGKNKASNVSVCKEQIAKWTRLMQVTHCGPFPFHSHALTCSYTRLLIHFSSYAGSNSLNHAANPVPTYSLINLLRQDIEARQLIGSGSASNSQSGISSMAETGDDAVPTTDETGGLLSASRYSAAPLEGVHEGHEDGQEDI